ncbi:MAG TPA: pyridoxamine 5'-phosphate oxidase family protein [Egibacteraceae bacterium]|jgi:hypothetical protein|nr:pyridoxamine 5'-phosphate oxidase family protein [Egibacteraceae bacterium]
MAKESDGIDAALGEWLEAQPVFFVATAPTAVDGHVNVSPKGLDTFRVLGARAVVYQDLTGSGAETVAHLRDNGRIVVMFCAFSGPPRIVRLHGRGTVVLPGDAGFDDLDGRFPDHLGTRAYVRVDVSRVSSSCGYAVPLMQLRGGRDVLDRWSAKKGPEGLRDYRAKRNARSIDGLPAYPPAQA